MKKIDWEDIREQVFGVILYVALIAIFIGGGFLLGIKDDISEVGFSNAVKNCTIKGNVNESGERIYHLVGHEYYKETTVEPNKGEGVYCNEEQAKTAGFRKSEASYTQEYLDEVEQSRQDEENDRCSGPAGSTRGC